ncbi:DUF6541 family protein [Microbacterium sp. NPDC055910]|uniref:DUF6541 family protein n=1 Tax=Microbacterium sp. NPDC055910 TaxID=3345659 RepID=UPI0035D9AAA2
MDWLLAIPAFLVALVVLFVPGLIAALAFRLRGLALWAVAPALSTAMVAVTATVLGFAGIAWTALSATLGCLVLSAAVWGVAVLLGRPTPDRPARVRADRLLIGVGLAAGAILIAVRLGIYIGAPANVSQTNDAIFHLNSLRFIAETGSASSFDISGVIGREAFYPAAWHALASFTSLLSGAEPVVAANVLSIALAAVVWPLGIAWMTNRATGGSAPATALAGVLSALTLTFPYLMFEWGVVYPYALSLAILPGAVGLLLSLPSWRERRQPDRLSARGIVGAILLLAIAAVGIAIAQPSTVLAFAIMGACVVVWWMLAGWRDLGGRARLLRAVGIVAALLAVTAAWLFLARGTSGSTWGTFQGRWRTIADILFNGQVMLPFLWGVSLLLIVGIVIAVRTAALRWILAVWLIFSGLYAIAASVASPALRDLLLGVWYGDPYRLAALAPLTVVPLAAVGAAAIAAWAARAVAAPRQAGSGAMGAVAVIAIVGLLAVAVAPVVQMRRVYTGITEDETRYEVTRSSHLSADELALFAQLDDLMPEGAVAVGNPSTGIAFGYVLTDRDVYPRTWSPPRTEEFDLISQELRDVADNPEVCAALDDIGAEYVLDFGPGEATPGRYVIPAMSGFDGRDGFELVAREGDASLWRVTACG